MTKRVKRIKKAQQNPKTVRFETIDQILIDQGFDRRQPKSGSSHYVYCKEEIQITIPYKKPYIKEIYIKKILEIIGEKI